MLLVDWMFLVGYYFYYYYMSRMYEVCLFMVFMFNVIFVLFVLLMDVVDGFVRLIWDVDCLVGIVLLLFVWFFLIF